MFFAVTGGKENRSSYGGLRYIEVRYIRDTQREYC